MLFCLNRHCTLVVPPFEDDGAFFLTFPPTCRLTERGDLGVENCVPVLALSFPFSECALDDTLLFLTLVSFKCNLDNLFEEELLTRLFFKAPLCLFDFADLFD